MLHNNREALKCLEAGKNDPRLQLLMELNDNHNRRGIEGHLLLDPDTEDGYLWFDQTNDPSDWWINFNARTRPVKEIPGLEEFDLGERVHRGWADAFENICPVLDSAMRLLGSIGGTLYITGHSLGAAIAAIASVYLRLHYPAHVYKTFIFGCPRVGNSAFRDLQNTAMPFTYNFRYEDDLVTRLPYNWLWPITWCWYVPVGHVVHLGEPRRWYRFLTGNFGRDHNWVDYYDALEEKANE